MVESEKVAVPPKGKKDRRCGHLKKQVVEDLSASAFEEQAATSIKSDSTVVMDNLASHAGVERVVESSERRTVPGKDAPKVLPWVHVAIANAKTLFQDMYHGVNKKFLQLYLDEYCYKFNRKNFGEKTFDRLVLAAISYRPDFCHQSYRITAVCG